MSLADSINATLIRTVLTQRATVYGRTGGTGPYNLVLKSGLACRLEEVERGRRPAATSAQRRELANLGTLRFDAGYTMPETGIQIEVTHEVINGALVASPYAGKRWNPTGATGWPDIVPNVGTVSKSIEVTRAL
jgi:hypothetical protein